MAAENETLRWPTNLDRKGIEQRILQGREYAEARGLSAGILGGFFLNGLISVFFCWFYRQPLVFFWTIPGTVLVGPALGHLS